MNRYMVLARDGYKCIYCGRSSYADGVSLHVDHIVAKSLGGKNVAGNLVTACGGCNLSKGNSVLLREREILEEVARRNAVVDLSGFEFIYEAQRAAKKAQGEWGEVEVEVRTEEVLVEPHPMDLLWSVWTLEEAARKLHLRIREVRKMIKDGDLLGRRSGKTWLIIDPDWGDRC